MLSDILQRMKILNVTEVARNFSAVLDRLEQEQEDVVLIRNHRRIARLVPEPPEQDALGMLGDLYRTLDEETAQALATAVNRGRDHKKNRLSDLPNPWRS